MLLFTLLSYLLFSLFSPEFASAAATSAAAALSTSAVEGSPGVDNIRFLLPVRPGDVLHGTAEITGVIPSFSDPRVLILQNKGELIRADGETVLTLTLSSRFRKRGSGVETVT